MKTALTIVLSALLSAGVIAANQLGAQTTTDIGVPPASTVTVGEPSVIPTPATTPTATTPATGASASVAVPSGTASVQNIVEITRMVPAGTSAVTAFTVPAGVVLVVTDLVITNTGTAATCGAALNRTGAVPTAAMTPTTATTPTTPATATTGTTATATTGTTATATSPVTTTVAGTLTQTDSTVTGPLCVPAQTTTTLPLTTGIEFGAGQSVQLVNTPDPAAAAGATAGTLGFHLRGILVTLT